MLDQFLKGISFYPKAFKVVNDNKLFKYIAIPGLMSLLYIAGFVALAWFFADDLTAFLYPGWLNNLAEYWLLSWLKPVIEFFLSFVAWLVFIVAGLLTYKFVILIIFAPVWGYISEVVEFTVNGQNPPDFNFKDMVDDILRSLSLTLRNTFWMIIFYGTSVLAGFIPAIGPVLSFIIIFTAQSYYEGVALSDYTLERKRYSVDETISFTKKNRYGIMGVGCGFTLMLLIPVLGWFTAPGYGTVAATLATLEKIENP